MVSAVCFWKAEWELLNVHHVCGGSEAWWRFFVRWRFSDYLRQIVWDLLGFRRRWAQRAGWNRRSFHSRVNRQHRQHTCYQTVKTNWIHMLSTSQNLNVSQRRVMVRIGFYCFTEVNKSKVVLDLSFSSKLMLVLLGTDVKGRRLTSPLRKWTNE